MDPGPSHYVQLRWNVGCTSETYVTGELWKRATIPACPFHPDGGCGVRSHGSYPRVRPRGVRVPRFLCPVTGRTISLLPDFLAAQLSSTTASVEEVVEAAQRLGVPAAAEKLRPRTGLQGGQRWVRRRLYPVVAMLCVLQGVFPDLFAGCSPKEIWSYRGALGTAVLPALRELGEPHLQNLIKPLGFHRGTVTHKPP